MRRKVVYNACYGGYMLSSKAQEMLKERGYDCAVTDIPRHNKDLIEIIEILGKEADTWGTKLRIFELPEDEDRYRIDSYDGYEYVVTPESVMWTKTN